MRFVLISSDFRSFLSTTQNNSQAIKMSISADFRLKILKSTNYDEENTNFFSVKNAKNISLLVFLPLPLTSQN